MLPFAENLKYCVEALCGRAPQADAGWLHPHEEAPPSPRLTYDHACLDCFLADLPGQDRELRLGEAVEDLRFAVATDDDKSGAATDPCFSALRADDRFRRLVGTPPGHFLDLSVLASHKEPLTKAGITSAFDLVRRTRSTAQRDQLAAYLKVSRVVVDQLRDVAMLAQVHRDLSEPAMLHLLIAVGVASPAALREEARRNPKQLVSRIRSQASEERLKLRGVRPPWLWLIAARR
ncbi:DUF4332 domain-containing protein [Streptomyces sp. NPDC050848]|uniref:DUF4332 domain-containing protein n=1 Tax=Streptomyces sp. NPDC050848 TaxID=3155791 RepID=UPI0033CCB4BC